MGLSDVLPKTLLAIHDVLRIRRVRGNDVFAALIAFPLIEFAFIAEREPPFLPAFRAIRRPWQIFLFIKFLFLRDNEKLLLAGFTGADFFFELRGFWHRRLGLRNGFIIAYFNISASVLP
jgi:hypothetical protein